ncbi:uncharacterized protein LOC135131333 [Zophobas morio]|uniref:uncharacterized protein LOC135131333 n=1 Tax=Zophobas morio TaxID=2755281 RepID=UPI00308312AE
MAAFSGMLVLLAVLVSTTSAFFLNWGSSNQETSPAYPQYFYHQRLMQPPGYTEPPVAVSVPSIPVQVPLQAQLAPAAVHNVQLVPCLCPVSQDFEYDKVPQEYVVTNQHKTT